MLLKSPPRIPVVSFSLNTVRCRLSSYACKLIIDVHCLFSSNMSLHERTEAMIHCDVDTAEKQFPKEINFALNESTYKPNARPTIFHSTIQEILFVFITTMGVAMPSLLQGCTIVISTSVKRDLNMSTTETTWMTASSA